MQIFLFIYFDGLNWIFIFFNNKTMFKIGYDANNDKR